MSCSDGRMKRILFALAGVWSLHAWSAEEVTPFELGCEMRQWTIDDGLPSNQVKRLAQTPDGYIWVGCSNGLARFNGTSFTRLSVAGSKMHEINVADFWVDDEGALWVLDARGHLLKRDAQGLQLVADRDEVSISASASLFKVKDRVMWLSHNDDELKLWEHANGRVDPLAGPVRAPSMYPGACILTKEIGRASCRERV